MDKHRIAGLDAANRESRPEAPVHRMPAPRRTLGPFKRSPVTALSLAAGLGVFALPIVAHGESPAIKKRQDILAAFGEAVKEPGAMLRNEAAFNLAVVQAALKAIIEGTPKLKELFPDDSKKGSYTESLPAIWEHKEHFLKLFDDMKASAAAAQAAVKDEASFRAEWGKVSASCRTCHKSYRTLPKT